MLFIVRPWILKLGESTSKSESIPQSERAAATTPVSGAVAAARGCFAGGAIYTGKVGE